MNYLDPRTIKRRSPDPVHQSKPASSAGTSLQPLCSFSDIQLSFSPPHSSCAPCHREEPSNASEPLFIVEGNWL